MGWTYKNRKLRDQLRKQYTEETGRSDFDSPEFERWLRAGGHLD